MGLDRQRVVLVTETPLSCANGFIGLSLESNEALCGLGCPATCGPGRCPKAACLRAGPRAL